MRILKINLFLFFILNCFFTVAYASQAHHGTHHEHSKEHKNAPSIKMQVKEIKKVGDKEIVHIALLNVKDEKPVLLNMLKEVHTKKIHFLIIDNSLTDYHHVHPVPTKEPGVYQFEWKPKKHATYRIWADLVPLEKNAQEYVISDLVVVNAKQPEIIRELSTKQSVDSKTFTLSFDKDKLIVGQPVMGKITITNAKGKPVNDLQPIMGAFAHIVGFNEDFNSIVHIHPLGKEPTKATDRGGPVLEFHMMPEKAGYIKLFAQVLINDKEIFVPFGVMIHNP